MLKITTLADGTRRRIFRCRFNPVEERQRHVHDDYVRHCFLSLSDRLASICCLGNHSPLGMFLEQHAQALPHRGVTVGQKNAQAVHGRCRVRHQPRRNVLDGSRGRLSAR